MSIKGIFSLLTRLLSEDFITHVTHHAALPMPTQRRHFCIEMALRLQIEMARQMANEIQPW